MKADAPSEEWAFAANFADFLGVTAAVPTASGSAALVTALEACGVGYGDEVLVPGLAWVACASAVVRVGAVPVFVDIDPGVYAMDPSSAEQLVGPRTAAVLVTHLSSSIADLDAFADLCTRYGLAMLEDCSQAHGAIWRGQRVGSFGRVAAFSFQSSKLLTAGEGGAAVTRDPALAEAMQQLRADGRKWDPEPLGPGFPDLVPGTGHQGHNYCMTEMQAAMLACALNDLDTQNQLRTQRLHFLESLLSEVEGIQTIRRLNDVRVEQETYWHLPLRIDSTSFGGASANFVGSALSRLAGIFLEPVGKPMPKHKLYRPHLYRRFPAEHVERLLQRREDLTGAEHISRNCFNIPHQALLADEKTLEQFVERLKALQIELQQSGRHR